MNVYVLRHGQTNWNAKQVVQGKMNESHLDETGIKQATAIREKLLNNVFDAVLVSHLHRAQIMVYVNMILMKDLSKEATAISRDIIMIFIPIMTIYGIIILLILQKSAT